MTVSLHDPSKLALTNKTIRTLEYSARSYIPYTFANNRCKLNSIGICKHLNTEVVVTMNNLTTYVKCPHLTSGPID